MPCGGLTLLIFSHLRPASRTMPSDAVLPALAGLHGQPHLLEVYLPGREFRVFVVNGRTVGGHERVPSHVIGDGRSTVAQRVRRTTPCAPGSITFRRFAMVAS